jgi:hypothetical protein
MAAKNNGALSIVAEVSGIPWIVYYNDHDSNDDRFKFNNWFKNKIASKQRLK